MSSQRLSLLLITTFSVFLSPTIAWFETCDFYYRLPANSFNYIGSPFAPIKYRNETSCRIRVTTPPGYGINYQCIFNIFKDSDHCTTDIFIVDNQSNSNLENSPQYCGNGTIQGESLFQEVTLAYLTYNQNATGAFNCYVYSRPQPCDCGWSSNTKIVGGVEAKIDEFPFMAGIVDISLANIFCGSTIISSSFVMSAAHCLSSFNNPSDLAIAVGIINTTATGPNSRLYRVNAYFIHPNYNGVMNDIALLQIQGEFEWSRAIGPACLPFLYEFAQFTGMEVEIAGWGSIEYGGPRSTTLLKASVQVVSNTMCQRFYDNLVASQMCTYAPNADACQFDSGGPVILTLDRSFVIGIISSGLACATTAGVNVRVTSYLAWIQSVIPTPLCRKN